MGFERIAIINRGEPAMRFINAVRDYRVEHGVPLTAIALYTNPDRASTFVSEADEAFPLGPGFVTTEDGSTVTAYVHHPTLRRALEASRADAVWTGWGFVAEDPAFVEMCDEMGIVTIGPSAETMHLLGDKIASKRLAEQSGVPVAPWSGGSVDSIEEALAGANDIGYPLLLKATAGGGGRGIRRVGSPDEMRRVFDAARREAGSAFGNPKVFLEALVPMARHIEVQIVGDSVGTVWAVGVRDCSVQRRNQKIIEEAPSPVLSPTQHAEVAEAAAALGRAVRYRSAGTVEFLYQPAEERFSFMEVNTRLQVEHPITEVTTGLDLVKLQLALALGDTLEGDPPPTSGHAIEVRLNAEDPERDFAPSPGRIELLGFPFGPGIRVDSGVEGGDAVVAEFDSMIAKVIAHGRDRAEAIARMKRALAQTTTIIAGGATNKGFVQAVMDLPEYEEGTIDVGWVDRSLAAGTRLHTRHADIALVTAALAGYEHQTEVDRMRSRRTAAAGRPEVPPVPVQRRVAIRHAGSRHEFAVACVGAGRYEVRTDAGIIPVDLADAGASKRLTVGARTHRTLAVIHGAAMQVDVDGIGHRLAFDEGGIVRSPSPALVVSIDVEPGDEVAAGDRLMVIEAMKMETSVQAEFPGRVREIAVHPNVQVPTGAPLLVLDLVESADAPAEARRVSLDHLAINHSGNHHRCAHAVDRLRNALLGYDIEPGPVVESMRSVRECSDGTRDDERRAAEDEVLGAFVDLLALFRREPLSEVDDRRGPEALLFDFLRTEDANGSDQPEWFVTLLRAALGHYGIDDLEPSPRRRAALYRLLRARAVIDELVPAIVAILDDRIARLTEPDDPALGALLDRLSAVSHDRYPAVRDLAAEMRYRLFDHPFLNRVREEANRRAEEYLARLEADPHAPARSSLIDALVEHPEPLAPRLTRRMQRAAPAVQAALVETTSRRFYRIRHLWDVASVETPTGTLVGAWYAFEGREIRLLATAVDWAGLETRLGEIRSAAEATDEGEDVVVDVYLTDPPPGDDADALASLLTATIDGVLGDLALRRIVITARRSATSERLSEMAHFCFRPLPDGGWTEDRLHRDLHPMMAKRLELRRLERFSIRRLPTPDDVYLFHGNATDNPRDERLFAIAEVRDLTRVEDAEGRTRIPELERVLRDVVAAIQHAQALRPPGRRLFWNRILLYLWPPIELDREEMLEIVRRLAPYTEDAGLQKVVVLLRIREGGRLVRKVLEIQDRWGHQPRLRERDPKVRPIRPLTAYEQRLIRLRQRGLVEPFDLARLLTSGDGSIPPGEFVEHDLVDGDLVAVDRPPGENEANVVVGVVSNRTERYPEGMRRVAILSDPSRGMGNVAEPECRRIVAALDLAERLGLPVEWFALSAGARISMESGTENMDWVGRVLRRLVEFTQAGGEVNVIVVGVNVGAQPYWNAEATMLMHTKGILVMTPQAAMVLTGKEALDFSGGVSAEDNLGIGGYTRIMGPNGQAQYFARDVRHACEILLQHYAYTYRAPGERFPRPAGTADPVDRDVGAEHHGGEFDRIAEIFSATANPDRKRAFEIRRLMAATVDADLPTLERWYAMQHAEVAVVWDAFLGGHPVCLLGIESKSLTRTGFVPADGPERWTSGTLFPQASKKVARAINAASGNRPVVMLANLSGFDGSPESMRRLQLEYGAEIGRAVVNFDGPIVFCVVSRYHGGAFVVFSATLNEGLEVSAVAGSKASVIGGAPAAGVVFGREVSRRVEADPRVEEAVARVRAAAAEDRPLLVAEADEVRRLVRAEVMHGLADDFDRTHSIERALEVGSVHRIVAPSELRPYLVDAVERGITRATGAGD